MPSTAAAKGCVTFDFAGYVVEVKGPAVGWFEHEYGAFRVSGKPPGGPVAEPDLRILPENVGRHGFHDAGFDVLPDHVSLDPDSAVIRYGPRARSGMLLEMTEVSMHWPDRVLVHAASVARNGVGTLIAAPNATGKTTALLQLLASGHDFLADDWSLLGRDGTLHPFPKSIHVYDYNVADRPALTSGITGHGRLRSGAIRFLARLRYQLLGRVPPRLRPVIHHGLAKRTWIAAPAQLGARVSPAVPLRRALWLQRCNVGGFEAAPLSSAEYVERIVSYLHDDRARHLQAYHRLRAFGHAHWLTRLARLHEHYDHVLSVAFENVDDIRMLRIPHEAGARDVADAVHRLIETPAKAHSDTGALAARP